MHITTDYLLIGMTLYLRFHELLTKQTILVGQGHGVHLKLGICGILGLYQVKM